MRCDYRAHLLMSPCFYVALIDLLFISTAALCDDAQYGKGREGDKSTIGCKEGQEGSKTAVCKGGVWILEANNCIISTINEIFIESEVGDLL